MTAEGGEPWRDGLVGAFALTVFAALLFVLLPGAANAGTPVATITVNTTGDTTGGPDCSLRDAITAANTDQATGGCTAGSGADTINFSVNGQINLGSTLPGVASELTIDGSGQNVVVNGQVAEGVLVVGAGASLAVDGFAIVNGGGGANGRGSGGAILNHGSLHVTSTGFSDDGVEFAFDGGAIYNDGYALVEDSTFSSNRGDSGGAIFNDGALTIRSSSFSENVAEQGGGIWNTGSLTVEECAFDGNEPGIGSGGAIGEPVPGQSGYGHSTLTIENGSFSANGSGEFGSGGGVVTGGGPMTVSNSAFSGNDGGIRSHDALSVTNSTFSGNFNGDGAGAITVLGSGTVRSSTFSSNVGEAGAIINLGVLSVAESTFAGNSTIDTGGFGGDAGGPGGGIYNEGTLSVANSTFVGNSTVAAEAGRGGGIANHGALTLTSSTLVGNSANAAGGIDNAGTVTLANSIVAGSIHGGNCFGPLGSSSRSNMSDDSSCGPAFMQVRLARLKLGPLADNGGPTQTIALRHGSVAINAGDNAAAGGLVTDQRGPGFPRIVRRTVDIGAFEVQ